ncbi:MAG: hypothetical protein KIH01_06265 [Candidatus Freyarchaeota archaeon]|nr:hypothetical protein [Candidatus Jordarchaeia archaeon]
MSPHSKQRDPHKGLKDEATALISVGDVPGARLAVAWGGKKASFCLFREWCFCYPAWKEACVCIVPAIIREEVA